MEICFLGTGSAINTLRFKTSLIVNDQLLIDVSPEAATLLRRAGVSLAGIEAIYLTHLHGDHYFGLPLLLSEYLVEKHKTNEIIVYGPAGTEAAVRSLLHLAYPEVSPDRFLSSPLVRFKTLNDRQATDILNLQVTPVCVEHEGVDAFGFRIEAPEVRIFITGDTRLCPQVLSEVIGADFSVVDMTTTQMRLPTHMNLQDVRSLLQHVSEPKKLFTVHRSGNAVSYRAKWFQPRDLSRYEVKRGCIPRLLKKISRTL